MPIRITEESRRIATELMKASDLLNQRSGKNFPDTAGRTWGEGLFDILVMGRFTSGKRTFINGIIGKNMMATSATAYPVFITTVEFGPNTNQVNVVYNDGRIVPKSLEQFTKELQLPMEDLDIFDPFSDVGNVEIQSSDSLFADGVSLRVVAGLAQDYARTITIRKFVPQADAIIFMLNATALFSREEQEYISDIFEGKCMRNVFFVVNRINQLMPQDLLETTVKPVVKTHLRNVFTDEHGVFDEALYNKRVFFVDAYCAQCARTGEPMKIMLGRRSISVKPDICYSGIPEFEEALSAFLNSRERFDAISHSILAKALRRSTGQF